MSNTTTMNIKKVHRNFLCGRWRDTLQEHFGVTINFPRGRDYEHGNFQTMILKGSIKSMQETRKEITRIIDEQDEQFHLRQNKRRAFRRNTPSSPPPPVIFKKSTTTKKNTNPFAALDNLDNTQYKTTKPKIIEIPVIKTKAPLCTMNFAKMAAKAKPVTTNTTTPKVQIEEKKVSFLQPPTPFRDTTSATSFYNDDCNDDCNEDNTPWKEGWAWGDSTY